MKVKDFDNYKFGIKTIVLVDDEWQKVVGVDFDDRIVEVRIGGELAYFDPKEIKDIKEVT